MRLFVYGTLKQGFYAHDLITNAGGVFIGEARTHGRYRLMHNPTDFPCMILSEESGVGVGGELYELPDGNSAGLKRLDAYECVSTGLFKREQIELSNGDKAMAYLYAQNTDGFSEIEEGVWSHNNWINDEAFEA
jgi:gamma-glutamylcyclotransferase (GGCT)/AIG2-like uncharacterized protein YtfP